MECFVCVVFDVVLFSIFVCDSVPFDIQVMYYCIQYLQSKSSSMMSMINYNPGSSITLQNMVHLLFKDGSRKILAGVLELAPLFVLVYWMYRRKNSEAIYTENPDDFD